MGRRAILAVVAATAVLAAGVGWFAGQRIKSPAEIAAESEPPDPSLITVPVELRTLSQNVVVRGTVRSDDEFPVPVSSTEGSTIITRLVALTGDEVNEGDVLIEVAGRPVFVLQGDLPVFRNLIPTLEGPDVRQLEEALVRLGYDPGDVDGVYSGQTSTAVAALYRDLGYSPVGGSEALQATADAAEDAVSAQEDVLDQAQDSLSAAQGTMSESERLQFEAAITDAGTRVNQARADADAAKSAAATAVTEAKERETAATTALDTATTRLGQARAGTHPDTGVAPTPQELTDLEAAQSAAQTELDDAKEAREQAEADEQRTITDQDALVASAEAALRLEEVRFEEAKAGGDTARLQQDVADAQSALNDARSELTEAQAKIGAQIPATEIIFLPLLPRKVQNLTVEVGDEPTGPVMTLTGAETVIESGLSAADRRLVEVGAIALLEDDGLGISTEAEVTFVAENPGGPNISADRYAMRLQPLEELPEDALNVNLRVSIPISSSGGDVLAVPFAALSAGPDGTARVEVEVSEGQVELVEVVTGLRAQGFVEVEPIDGALNEGDRVVVGSDVDFGAGTDGADSGSDADTDADTDTDSDPASEAEPDEGDAAPADAAGDG